MSVETLNFVMAMAATIAFAITGVLAVSDRRVDFFSAVVLGVITAIGGGTIRDLILDVPVFWAADLSYVRFAVLASILTFIGQAFFSRPQIFKLILYIDGLGIALFGIAGAGKLNGHGPANTLKNQHTSQHADRWCKSPGRC